MSAPIVIVGGGLAAGTAVVNLRELGYDGELVVFAGEPHVPYERPPLSKSFLAGETPVEKTYVKPESWYAEHGVELHVGVAVTGVDLDARSVSTPSGTQAFSRLLLATGARARQLTGLQAEQGEQSPAVCYLRTIDDSVRLRGRFTAGSRLLVVGGGWIGLEAAATARGAGVEVTLVEPESQPLVRALGPELGGRLADVHRKHGVDLRTGTSLSGIEGGKAQLSDGTELAADTILIGIGAVPNDELARSAGLAVDNGVLVDESLASSDPDVFVAGDLANVAHPVLKERVRVEHWQTALSQGRVVARSLLGEEAGYDEIPSFFSDQYDLGLEYFGYPGAAGTDEVRIEPGAGDGPDSLVAWWYRDGKLVAAAHVNDWDRSAELAERVREGK